MAKKPRTEWSDAYRKRVERAEARGLTRQQARGHKEPKEYQRRAAKEIQRRGITGDQLKTVARYANKRAARNKSLQPSTLVDWAKTNGWRAFTDYRATRDGAARDYRQARKAGTYKPTPVADFKSGFGGGSSGGGGSGGGGRRQGSVDGGPDYVRAPDYGDEGEDDYFADEWDGEYDDLDIEWMYYHDD